MFEILVYFITLFIFPLNPALPTRQSQGNTEKPQVHFEANCLISIILTIFADVGSTEEKISTAMTTAFLWVL